MKSSEPLAFSFHQGGIDWSDPVSGYPNPNVFPFEVYLCRLEDILACFNM